MKPIGTFRLRSERATVTDPCYEKGTWCAGTVGPVKQGVWQGYVAMHNAGDWGNRVDKLIALHEDQKGDTIGKWSMENFSVGVDSGSAGIFDFKKYPDDKEDLETWRFEVYDATDKNQYHAATCGFGLASSSGYGDGGYTCYTHDKKDKIVGIMIDFGVGIPLRALLRVSKELDRPFSDLLDQETRLQTLRACRESLPLLLKIDKDLNAEIEQVLREKP